MPEGTHEALLREHHDIHACEFDCAGDALGHVTIAAQPGVNETMIALDYFEI